MSYKVYSGTGTVYVAPVDAAGARTGGYRQVGDAYPLSLQVSTKKVEVKSRMVERAGQIIASKTEIDTINGKLTLREWNAANLAWALSGSASALSAASGSESADEVVAVSGAAVPLAHRNVSSLVVTRTAGDDAAAWTATAEITSGAYRIPTTPNGHFYKATVGGDTGGTEPTWPTDGSTVSDGTVTWQDMGTIIAAATDYQLDATLGLLTALATGDIEDGETLSCAYDYAAQADYRVDVGSAVQIRVAILAHLYDEYRDKHYVLEIDSAVLSTNSEINFISEEGSTGELLQFDLTLETLSGMSSPARVDGIPI